MSLSNTATPKYYKEFRDSVLRGEIPVNKQVAMQMSLIDELIANPGIYYDDKAVEGFIKYCENELTLTDGSDMFLLPSFINPLLASIINMLFLLSAYSLSITIIHAGIPVP